MAHDSRDAVRAWLEAERAGDADRADLAFRQVAAHLPRLRPSAAFADAVMRRVVVPAREAGIWASWWLRGLVAGALVSVGAVVVSLSGGAWLSAGLSSIQAVAWAVGRAGTVASAWIGSALAAWGGLAHAATVVGRLLAGPDAVLVLLLNLTAAAAALLALRRLLPVQEN